MQFEDKIKSVPFLRLLIPFIIGIIFGIRSGIEIEILFFLIGAVMSSLILLVSLVLKKHQYRYVSGFVVFIFMLLAGWFLSTEKLKMSDKIDLPEDALLIATIQNEPKETENSVSVQIAVNAYRMGEEWCTSSGNAMVYLQKDSISLHLTPGTMISFRPTFDSIQNAGNPEEFDYAQYMSYHLIASQTYLKSGTWKIIGRSSEMGVRQYFLKLRNSLLDVYKDIGLEGDEFAVAAALSLGYKDKLQDELKHAYSSSGAMHVLAVSGLHVGIIFMVLQFLLAPMRRVKKLIPLQVLILIISIWFYAALTGLSPSVTRAAVMFSFISGGKLFKQHVNTYNILAASAFVTIFFNPLVLTELGFWLSYLAVLSITLFYKPIYSLILVKNKILDKLWSLVTVSIAAQIGTAPLTVYFFHQFSNYFILTNILVIPIVTIIVYLAMAAFILSFIPILAKILGTVLGFAVGMLNKSVFFIEKIPGAVSSGLFITEFQMCVLFAGIVFLTIFFIGGKRHYIWPALISVILFVSVGIFRDVKSQEQEVFLVYNLRGNTGVNCIIGKEHVLFTDFEDTDIETKSKNLKNYWLAEGVNKEKYVDLNCSSSQYMFSNIMSINNPAVFLKQNFIGFRDLRVFILRDDKYSNRKVDVPLALDYIVLANDADVSVEDILRLFIFKKIIIDSSNSWYYRQNMLKLLDENSIEYYDVSNKGAFIEKLN